MKDPYLDLTYEKREKMKEEIQEHLNGQTKKEKNFGKEIFNILKEVWDPETLKEGATTSNAEEAVESLDPEILKNSSDDLKIMAIKQNIEANGQLEQIENICAASEIYMPQTYQFLKNYTTSEFKRMTLIHDFLGLWLDLPTVGEMARRDPEVKKYFKTYIRLLEDRGIEQDKYFKGGELAFMDKESDIRMPNNLKAVLAEDKENERYNDIHTTPVTGTIVMNDVTLEMQVFDGKKWSKIGHESS